MALLKTVELDNGIIVNYHRIVSINKITNHDIILEIASYTSKNKREEEMAKSKTEDGCNVYIKTNYINVDYDETSTIKDWYNYLKTTETFFDAEDV